MYKILLAYCFILALVPTAATAINNNYKSLLIAIYIKNIDTEETLLTINNNGNLFIPFGDFIQLLKFDLHLKGNIIEGNFFNQFKLHGNIKTGEFQVNNEKITAKKEDFLYNNNELFISYKFLQTILKLIIDIDLSKLNINIHSNYIFPIEIYLDKIDNRSNFTSYKDALELKKKNKYEITKAWFSYPVVDINVNYGQSNNSYYIQKYTNTNIALGMTFLGLDSKIYNTSNHYYHDTSYNYYKTTANFSKTYINNNLLRYFEFGDINTASTILINNNNSGRGITLTSNPNYNINQDKTVNIKGYLKDGWDVELYYNNSLISYQNSPNADHFYEFYKVPVYLGTNKFKLIFYGPLGEKTEEEKIITVGSSPVMKNEFAYTISLLQTNKPLFDDYSSNKYFYNYFTPDNKLTSIVNLYYGILDNLAINASYSGINNTLSSNQYYTQGLIYSLFGFTLENYIAEKQGYNKYATHHNIYGSIGKLGYINIAYSNFNDIMSPLSYRGAEKQTLQSYFKALYNRYVNIFGVYLPVYIEYNNYKYNQHQEQFVQSEQDVYVRSSYSILNSTTLTLESSYHKQYVDSYRIKSSIISRFNPITIQGSYEFSVYPYLSNSNIYASIDYYLGKNTKIMFEVNHFYNKLFKNSYYRVGFTQKTFLGNFSAVFGFSKQYKYDINVMYNISLGYNSSRKTLFAESDAQLHNNSTIIANVFIDNDNNGKYNKNIDKPIANAKILIGATSAGKSTNQSGEAIYTGIPSYVPLDISIDQLSISNIMLVPKLSGIPKNIILRPSEVKIINVPYILTGHIEGALAYVKNSSCKSSSGIIEIYNQQNIKIKQTFMDTDGLFIFENIPYGNYYLKYNCKSYKITVNKDINYVH